MYVNDRDQINYHGFLKALREMQGANLKQVAEGICSDSEISRMEIGDRLPEKLMRDRVTSRLGVSGEEYEEYLRPEEFRQWEIRMFILEHINKGDTEAVQRGIDEYDRIPDKNPVQEQFADTMRYMLAKMKEASEDILRAYIELAVVHTIPDIDIAFAGAQLLADQELHLITEYTSLREYYGNPENEFEWRLAEYQRILDYMDKSYMDTIGKSKVYPRVTCGICELVLTEERDSEILEYALNLCSKSIELLRDASRLYYFVELVEYRKLLISRLLESGVSSDKEQLLKDVYEKDSEWESLFKELYTEYDVPIYMQNFTHLYVETECNSAVEVIRTRRNMLKLSRVKVSDNICTDKTVERFENYTHSPSIVVIRDIFDRIGLCAEYKRARVITSDAKTLYLSNELASCLNDFQHDKVIRIISELKEKLHMDISYNQQEVYRNEYLVSYRNKSITNEQFADMMKKTMEYTLPIEALVRNCKKYLTRSELTLAYDLAFKTDDDVSYCCKQIIIEMCENSLKGNLEMGRMCTYEMLAGGTVSYLGNQGKYAESNEMSVRMLKESLAHRRMVVLADNLYNILWNSQEEAIKNGVSFDKAIAKVFLKKGILLCEIIRKNNWVIFFQEKLKQLKES